MNFRSVDLRALNSATKYPSIVTLHTLGERGVLGEPRVAFEGRVIGREKIDGTNARILLGERGFLIGSRESLLHAEGDLCFDPAQGIVEPIRDMATMLSARFRTEGTDAGDGVVVVYGECYGGKIGSHASHYTGRAATGFRVFDVAIVEPEILCQPVERIAEWRESGGQRFLAEDALREWIARRELTLAPLVFDGDADAIPGSIPAVRAWLDAHATHVQCALDDSARGEAEGVVLRTADRSTIAKARFDDYRRTERATKAQGLSRNA